MSDREALDDDLKTLVMTIAALDFARREIDDMRALYPELDFAIENALAVSQDVLLKASHAAEARRAKRPHLLDHHDEVE